MGPVSTMLTTAVFLSFGHTHMQGVADQSITITFALLDYVL